MVATLQRWIVFSLLVASTSVATFSARIGHTAVGLSVAVLLLFGYSFILAVEFVCVWCVEPQGLRPSIGELTQAWWGETKAAPRVFYWRQPFRAHLEPDNLRPGVSPRRGVLLVHGLVCNRGFWNPWMRRLRSLGIPFIAVDLEPPFALIDAYAALIETAMRRLEAATGVAPVIVAHSMGGLAVRHWQRNETSEARVHRLITIGTPHHGTWMARFGRSPSGRQMAIGSDWLGRMNSAAPPPQNVTCFYGDCDNVVFPASNAQLAGAVNRRIARTAHVALAFKSEVFAEALRWLEEPRTAQ